METCQSEERNKKGTDWMIREGELDAHVSDNGCKVNSSQRKVSL